MSNGVLLPELRGKRVVITGASRGIGLALARAFAAQGATLFLLADDPAVHAAAAQLGAVAAIVDITKAAEVAACFEPIEAIDVLINNAGLERLTPLADASAENLALFRRLLDINVTGTFIVTSTALPKIRPGGRIIITASTWSRSAEPLFGAYVAAKHALIGLIKTWSREVGKSGITVNGVAPGWTRTAGTQRSLAEMAEREGRTEEEILGDIVAGQSLQASEMMEPDDVAGAYLYLASSLAANVTGQTVGVDRGEVPW
jgi:NAD(P)-dependent dehydrogenase (short-subunit alcohol dehydrogenase family)